MSDEIAADPVPDDIAILSRTRVHDGLCSVEAVRLSQQRRDGAVQEVRREVVRYGGDVVAVLPVDRARRTVLLCRQLRVPMLLEQGDPFPWEVCAGRREAGEEALACAWRELDEELGLVPRTLGHVGVAYTSPGILANRADLYLADYTEADRRSHGGGVAGEGEDIEVVELTCAALAGLLAAGALRDAKTLILVQHLMLTAPALFRQASGTP
ncbi:NUDIX domain-containing protein [Polymorphum gilvum]|uniref:GDP-mannose pyrophosphatase n=1 Tax=Polymorphum gilvum (strain LMG 25793 / CGMCC 1.9160 / SL003B-26A1) TaxID=991905 RepID=F2J105_POLGS|nr:NUDIX domain-containing protein [Polymorphum gilvum]ADZ71951.1 Hydrolase YffH [Polymorphum gilvum SL003B-26A1]